ncbi:Diphthamide biosynthesis protein 4 [Cryomyces antarcticus]
MSKRNHYVVLGLPHPTQVASLTVQDIKLAYRRALLIHHPDKSVASQGTRRSNVDVPKHTVDDITIAYRTLSDPSLRADYDRDLRLQFLSAVQPDTRERTFHSGLETVDLDELNFDEAKSVWTRGCRCGQEQGFVVIEEELEKEAEFGELVTGCRGCSLWLRVLFQTEAEDMGDTRANDAKADMG